MSLLAIIGGSGLTEMDGLEITRRQMQGTPYGQPSGTLTYGELNGKEVVFLPRHGNPHVIPPHRINYRANILALKENGVSGIIAANAVGGITGEMYPGRIVIPTQLVDYTWGRKHTFFEDNIKHVTHIDLTDPYDHYLRQSLINAADKINLDIHDGGTYGATQGPRLETSAEIRRMENDGCDLVGMTGMPEAALARELNLPYASVCVVANWAAGKTDSVITMEEIDNNLKKGITDLCRLLEEAIPLI